MPYSVCRIYIRYSIHPFSTALSRQGSYLRILSEGGSAWTSRQFIAYFWDVGGNQRKPTQTQGEHANSTQKHPDLDSNPGPSCREATVLTTVFIFPQMMTTIIKCHKDSSANILCNMIKFTGLVVWSGIWSTWWFTGFSIILAFFRFIS